MFSPLKVATQGRHSRSPLKAATQGGHSRSPLKVATLNTATGYTCFRIIYKNVTCYKKNAWDPLRDVRGKSGIFSLFKVATQGGHSRWPFKVATQGGHCMLKRTLDIQLFALYVKTVTSYNIFPRIPEGT
jgi:hypothetical protein